MLTRLALSLTLFGWLATTTAWAQISADDFLPPVQGGTTEIKEPAKVKVEGKVIMGPTAQDTINAAIKENTKAPKSDDGVSSAYMVKFPSGLGFVASGTSYYQTFENPTATRIAQRKAYVVAFVQAKKELAKVLDGLSTEGKTLVRDALKTVTLPKEDLANLSGESEESIKQAVDMMLRGFVIYEVKDDPKQKAVTVSIVTTPKTRGKLARLAPASVEVESLRDGLNQIIQEVRNGIVPPVGGRIIVMRTTGETAFVGFGSAVIATHANNAVQARFNLNALKVAGARADDALCGLIIGDQLTWQGTVSSSTKDEYKDFAELNKGDPLAKNNLTGIQKLEKAHKLFVSKERTEDMYLSARKGKLPPGVQAKMWFDEDKAWAYAMSVYVPSLSRAAAQTAKEMKEAVIIQPNGQPAVSPAIEAGTGPDTVNRPNPKVKPGPSGKVGNEKDM